MGRLYSSECLLATLQVFFYFFVGFERKILSEIFIRVNLPGMQNSAAALEKSLAFLQMIKQKEWPYDLPILLLDLHPGEIKAYVHTNTCTRMFMEELFTIAQGGNNPNIYQRMNGSAECVTSGHWDVSRHWRGMMCSHMLRHSKHYTEWKKPVTKIHMLEDSDCVEV